MADYHFAYENQRKFVFFSQKARGCYNLGLNMCYPLPQKYKLVENSSCNNSILYHFFFYWPPITHVKSISEQVYIGNKIISQNVQLSIKFQLINDQ